MGLLNNNLINFSIKTVMSNVNFLLTNEHTGGKLSFKIFSGVSADKVDKFPRVFAALYEFKVMQIKQT